MSHAPASRGVTLAKPRDGQSWRGRTALACGVAVSGVVGVTAVSIDWSQGLAMGAGELAGIVAPLALISLGVWAVAALAGRKG